MEAFSVTGSNIKRLDVESALPVTVLTRETIEARNAITPVEMLTSLPQVTNVPLNESTQGSAGARGDVSAINLRGIGASNSLILLNGRRLVAHPTSGALNYSVNVNQLPTQGIGQIEVLRDGASSIYGSDAVAGVINYIMSREFRGTEVKVRYGHPEAGGGSNVQGTLTFGKDFAGGRVRLLTTVDYLYRDAIRLTEREFTASADNTARAPAPFNVPGSQFDGRGAVGFYPTFRIGTATATNWFRPVNGVLTLTSVGPTRAANPEFYVNSNQFFIGSPRSKRTNWFTALEYDLTDTLTAFADLSFYHADSSTVRTPISMSAPTADSLAPISVDNPFNPYGSRFYNVTGAPNTDGTARLVGAPRPIVLLAELIKDLPPDRTLVTSNLYRYVAGLRGKLGDTWTWEAGGLFSKAAVTDQSPNYVRESLLQAALMRTDATAFNPFGSTFKVEGGAVVSDRPYTNPASVMASFIRPFRRDGKSEIASLDARASGTVYSLWSGDISLALGGEYRLEEFSDLRPPFVSINPPDSGLNPLDNDFLQFPPAPDSSGDRTISSVYAETVIPLVAPKNNVLLLKSLEVAASVRYEKYNDFGDTTKPKVGVNWRPLDAVMLRASYSEGFTAPSLPMLNAPTQFTTSSAPGTFDPYRNAATGEGPYVTRNITSGNAELQPATSEGKSVGIVIEVPKVTGLSLTADYWEIAQEDVIGSRTVAQSVSSDDALLRAFTAQQLASGRPINSIDAGSGTSAYKGDSAVVRLAPSASDIALFGARNAANPGSQFAVVGPVLSIASPFLNLAEGFVSGWDFGLNYSVPQMEIGKFSFNTDWSYLLESYTIQNPPNARPIYNERREVNGASRWRGSSTIGWRKNLWSASFSAYYTGPFADTGATTTAAIYQSLGRPSYIMPMFDAGATVYRYKIDEVMTFNASVSRRFAATGDSWLKDTSIRVGVVNLTDLEPPLAPGATGYSTGVHGNLLVGRTWTVEISKRF
jgi:outer membrane receptor protein involved in Fe transport